MSRNHDGHTKNFSFLMDKNGNWTFVPAYDLCYSYTPGGKWTNRHQLSLNGKHIIEQIGETVSHWKDYAKEGSVKEAHSQVVNDNLLLLAPKTIAIHKPTNEKDKETIPLSFSFSFRSIKNSIQLIAYALAFSFTFISRIRCFFKSNTCF